MERPIFFDQVKQHLQFLIDDYQFSVIEERYYPDAFGDCLVLMQSRDCRVSVGLDRGAVFVKVGSLAAADLDSPNSWFDIMNVTAFVTQGSPQEPLAYELPDDALDPAAKTDWQLSRLSKILQLNWENILHLFSHDVFEKKQQELVDFGRKRLEERLKQL
jgi:hypothetical protein